MDQDEESEDWEAVNLDARNEKFDATKYDVVIDKVDEETDIEKGEDIYLWCTRCNDVIYSRSKENVYCVCFYVGIDLDYAQLDIWDYDQVKVVKKKSAQSSPKRRAGKGKAIKLQLESGESIDAPSVSDLSRIEGEEFAILSREELTYLQCATQKIPPYGYILEYQDGTIDRHFTAIDMPISFDRVRAAFRKYLKQDDSWKDDFEWVKL